MTEVPKSRAIHMTNGDYAFLLDRLRKYRDAIEDGAKGISEARAIADLLVELFDEGQSDVR
jgi:hypothetical protein